MCGVISCTTCSRWCRCECDHHTGLLALGCHDGIPILLIASRSRPSGTVLAPNKQYNTFFYADRIDLRVGQALLSKMRALPHTQITRTLSLVHSVHMLFSRAPHRLATRGTLFRRGRSVPVARAVGQPTWSWMGQREKLPCVLLYHQAPRHSHVCMCLLALVSPPTRHRDPHIRRHHGRPWAARPPAVGRVTDVSLHRVAALRIDRCCEDITAAVRILLLL